MPRMTARTFPSKKSRVATLVVGFVLLAGAGRAQGTMATIPVRGVVVNSATGQPIARALVDAGFDATLTDGEGRFELRLAESYAQITVRRPGFSEKQEDTTHRIRVSAQMPEMQFSLPPAASLTGHVTLSTGDEAAGIHFTAYRRQVVDGHARWMPNGMAETNSEGGFQFNGIEAPALYVVCNMEVNDHFAAPAPGATLFGYPSACFPGGSDFLSAAQMTISPGQQKDLEIVLIRQRLYPVSIAAPNPPPGQGVQIEIYDRAGRPSSSPARWDAKRGMVDLELPNGSYSLELRSWGKQPAFGRLDFRVANAPVTGMSLPLAPVHPIEVEILKEFTSLSGQEMGDRMGLLELGRGASVNLSVLPRDSLIDGPMGTGLNHPEGAPSGVFQMEGIRPGRYLVRIDSWDGYASSITSGSTDLARDPLIVGAGGTAAPIEITLRNDWGQIACDLRGTNANAASGTEMGAVFLYAIPQFPSAAHMPQMTLGNMGEYTWPRIPPGTYRVAAFDKAQEMNLDDGKEMARWNSLGQTVKVNPGGTATVQLDVIKSAGENP